MTFVIASQPRTGSHFLAQTLGILDDEPFSNQLSSATERINCIRDEGIIVHDYQWSDSLGNWVFDAWRPDKIVWLWRKDIFSQSASHMVSCITGKWQGKIEYGERKIVLNGIELLRNYTKMIVHRPHLFEVLSDIPCVHTTYEKLQHSYERMRIASFLGRTPVDARTERSQWQNCVSNLEEAREQFWKELRR